MHDSLTAKSVVESLERKHGSFNRVWVMDRSMVSNDNLECLRERGAKYIVGTPKSMLRAFERELAERKWVVAQEGVDVRLRNAAESGRLRDETLAGERLGRLKERF